MANLWWFFSFFFFYFLHTKHLKTANKAFPALGSYVTEDAEAVYGLVWALHVAAGCHQDHRQSHIIIRSLYCRLWGFPALFWCHCCQVLPPMGFFYGTTCQSGFQKLPGFHSAVEWFGFDLKLGGFESSSHRKGFFQPLCMSVVELKQAVPLQFKASLALPKLI